MLAPSTSLGTGFARVAIIGLGLIGSSIARGVRQHMPTARLTGYDADPAVRARADSS